MSVWFAIPSKRPAAEAEAVLKAWRERGYKIALWRDEPTPTVPSDLSWGHVSKYPGYAVAVNTLFARILEADPAAEWLVTGGDDVLPDPNHSAEEIAAQCSSHFYGRCIAEAHIIGDRAKSCEQWKTFSVMQPTGDRWGDKDGAYIDRVAGSPWIGREFARRMYQGNGPYWPEYTHMGVDEELQLVAEKLGVFWQRPDLTHYHQHWGRPNPGEVLGQRDRMPVFLEHANSRPEWDRFKRIIAERKAAGFPGHEPL